MAETARGTPGPQKELLDWGEGSIYARVLQDMRDREARDSGRAAAPLRRAEDAIVLDTTGMDENLVLETALKAVMARSGRTRAYILTWRPGQGAA